MNTSKNQNTDTELTLGFCPRSLILFTQFALIAKRNKEYQSKMKKNNSMKPIITIILILSFALNLGAQESSKEIKTRPFQITFVTPLGTNGLDAWNITNNFSINLYAGYNGGLDGVELSGFGGMLKNNMKGTQIAGFGNIVMGTGNGFQAAGFFNYSHQYFQGAQIAGFANVINSDTKAWQFSGFSNVATGNSDAAQFSGFANYSKGNSVGQISGFSNVNSGNLKGFQIAGFSNVNTDSLKGIQIAGFSNYTKTLNGIQIAPFNYVDSLEKGMPFGLFSIVKNGYRAFEISVSETLFGTVSFKTGTTKFYNIVSVGASYKNDQILWGWGYGIGTMFAMKNDWNMTVELLSYQINVDEWFTEVLNLNNKLQITTSKKVAKNLHVFGGITWNVNVSDIEDHDGNVFKSTVSPWNVFDKTYNNETNVKMYPGFTAGIRF